MLAPCAAHADEWAAYGRDAGGTRYSPLKEIDRSNVARLKVAWTFHTGDIYDGKDKVGPRSGFQTTPLLTVEQGLTAMRRADEAATRYRPPVDEPAHRS